MALFDRFTGRCRSRNIRSGGKFGFVGFVLQFGTIPTGATELPRDA